jgi:hypothetical protein
MAATVIGIHRPGLHRIVELTLRAACDLVAGGGEAISSTSVTVELRGEDRAALDVLRRAEALALEYGVRVRMEVQGPRATIRVSRDPRH